MNSNLSSPNTTYQLYQSWIQKELFTHGQWASKCVVIACVSWCALCTDCLIASCSTALHTTPYYLSYPCALVSERRDACVFWHKHKVPLGSFLDPLHTVYHEATKVLSADCIKSKGGLWAKPGKRPAADSGAAGILSYLWYCSRRCLRNANHVPLLEHWVSAAHLY